MTTEQIRALDVATLAADAALCWLWTTNAHLPEAFTVLAAWGCTYKTLLTWGQERRGTGDWLRGQTEHCLLRVRGRSRWWSLTLQTTALTGKVREHSRKPAAFYQLVEQ